MAVVVLDTNIWLDLLVFDDAGTAWLGAALHAGRLRAAIDAFGLDELTRVLGYPLGRFAIARERRPAILDPVAPLRLSSRQRRRMAWRPCRVVAIATTNPFSNSRRPVTRVA